MKKYLSLLITPFLLLAACKNKTFDADLLIKNAVVYKVDSTFSTAQAIVVNDGKIVAVGDDDTIDQKYKARQVVDAEGKPVYPGFIDAHAHFFEYGLSL